ncbi:hypothetical protein CYY_001406 [Polysphondylium violaceum]|uniref:Uncharacterized protein n=1 Tax=Polysphondylium violaceum TaxID=133409 RepID=A0A8J4UW79_9MYCE|nr:hypothetical protein CYY_001406 [Polysphondylium violaceum]
MKISNRFIIYLILIICCSTGCLLVESRDQSLPDNDPVLCQQRIQREDCPVSPAPFEPVDDTNVIQVYYLQAPIFEGMFGNFFGKLGGYHSAVGFYDLTTGLNYTAEYDAFYEVGNGTVPNIVYVNGTKDILWCNSGIVCAVPFVNATYWDPAVYSTASKTYMATIDGATFNKYSQWMVTYNNSNPIYQTWDVWNNYNQELYIQSSTCDDFADASFAFLNSVGVQYNCSTIVKRDYVNIYSQKPVLVDYDVHKLDIISFYEVFDFRTHSFLEVLKKLVSMIGLKKYLYIQGEYYLLELNFPFIGLKYDFAPLPGCYN